MRNALVVYERLQSWSAHSQQDLLASHGLLMLGLMDGIGAYRSGGVGVMSGESVIHMAPPASMVAKLMHDLLGWVTYTDVHPLIASCVFHYEFEFIHPFADGNGRMGRLWQTLMLSKWQPVFLDVPVESLIHAHQAAYYQAIAQSNAASDSTVFVEFMLTMILQALNDSTPAVAPAVTPEVDHLLSALTGEMTRRELQLAVGLSDEKNFRARFLLPALAAGVICPRFNGQFKRLISC